MFNDVNKLSNVGEASEILGLLMLGGESLGRREKLPQKVGGREKLGKKVGRREIYPPVPPPLNGSTIVQCTITPLLLELNAKIIMKAKQSNKALLRTKQQPLVCTTWHELRFPRLSV